MKTTTIIDLLIAAVLSLFAVMILWSNESIPPFIPSCLRATDVIVGNGEYNPQTGYWSEYHCVSEMAFGDSGYVDRKSGD